MPDNSEDLATEVLQLPHPFEIEVHTLVILNHQLTLGGIEREKEELLGQMKKVFKRDPETLRSVTRRQMEFYEDLRKASRNLALVGLVTRLQHWVARLVKQVSPDIDPNKLRPLAKQLEFLNGTLGSDPVPVTFFEELETARDSIIHNDSQVEWEYRGKQRRVVDRYVQYGELNFSEKELWAASEKCISQIAWYDKFT